MSPLQHLLLLYIYTKTFIPRVSQGPKSCDIATQLQNKLNSNVGKQGEKNQTMKDTLIKGKSDTDFHS